jgi:hypothetical protein
MIRTRSLLFLLFLMVPMALNAQLWSGIISPSRATDWSTAGIPGGIPSGSWSQCGATIAAYGSSSAAASSATINNALAGTGTGYTGCSTPYVILLGAGDFYLSNAVDFTSHSNVVLRGQGANQTRLHFAAGQPGGQCNGWGGVVCLVGSNTYAGYCSTSTIPCTGTWTPGYQGSANWTAGYSQGATSITLSSTSGLSVGTPIVLDQCDTGLTGTSCSGTTSDNGQFFVCEANTTCATELTANTNRPWRGQEEVVVVTAISGSTVTISPGLRNPNWASGQSPQAWWGNSTITNSGIENLLVDNSANALRGIVLGPSYKCWVKGVASDDANNYHVFNTISSHNVVRDSYFYWTVYNGTTSYGIGGQTNGDLLMENNILQGIVDPINFDSSCSGCVAGYNFAVNQYYSGSINYLFGIISYHAVGESMILGEGNIGSFPDSDNIHGTHDMNTLYRNYFNGDEPNNGTQTTKDTAGVHVAAFSRYYNIVGNVLGTAGYHTTYQCAAPSASAAQCADTAAGHWTHVYDIGWSSNTQGQIDYDNTPPVANDTLAGSTLLRWGNYDTVTGAARWCGNSSDTGWSTTCSSTSEVPTGISNYPNSVPTVGDTGAGQGALPGSFYYSSKPGWYNVAWPSIGPDVSSGNILTCTTGTYQGSLVLSSGQCGGGASSPVMSGHAVAIPAMACYLNQMGGTPDGTGSMKTFNASACYTSSGSTGSVPAAPTNLGATVQ